MQKQRVPTLGGGLILRQSSIALEPHGLGVVGIEVGVVGIDVGVVGGAVCVVVVAEVAVVVAVVAIVAVVVAVVAVGVIDVLGHMQQSSEESKLGKVILSQASLTQTSSPKQSSSPSQSPWPSPH